jgi:hypothetical protein
VAARIPDDQERQRSPAGVKPGTAARISLTFLTVFCRGFCIASFTGKKLAWKRTLKKRKIFFRRCLACF